MCIAFNRDLYNTIKVQKMLHAETCNNIILKFFKAKQENISGDFRGDGFQNGGTLVVAPGEFFLIHLN